MFEVVHSYVWGPNRVSSNIDFHYFVTFIDNYSRCTWLFLMKIKFDLFSIFQTFCAEIRNQFGVSIKKLISDNAKYYFTTSFSTFRSFEGILHQSYCAHTLQQNGIA